MRRTASTVAAALVLAVTAALAGCTAPSSTSSSTSSGGGGAAAGFRADTGAAGDAGPASAKVAAGAAPAEAADRQVVTTASAQVTAEDTARAADRTTALVERAGGRTQERSEGGEGGQATARLVVRVPSSALTDVLDALRGVGAVTRVSVRSSDVTAAAVDLDARISALQTSTARLQGLLDRAATTADLVAAEGALADRQGQLESLQSQRRLLAGQVDLATLTLTLVPRGVAAAGPDGFGGGLAAGWHALARAGAGLLVVVGVLLPWVLVLAVVAAVAAAAVRSVRALRRRPTP